MRCTSPEDRGQGRQSVHDPPGSIDAFLTSVVQEEKDVQLIPSELRERLREARITIRGCLKHSDGLFQVLPGIGAPDHLEAAEVQVVGFHVLRRSRPQSGLLPWYQLHSHGSHDVLGDLGLDRQYVRHVPVVAFRPDTGIVRDQDQLWRNPHATLTSDAAVPANGPFENEVDTEVRPDLRDRLPLPVVSDGGSPRDDGETLQVAEAAHDLLGHALCKVVILRRTKILEGKHYDPRRLSDLRRPHRGPDGPTPTLNPPNEEGRHGESKDRNGARDEPRLPSRMRH